MLMVGIPKSQLEQNERGRKLAVSDRAMLDEVLGVSPFGHVGFVQDGMPVVTPAFCWREGAHVYLIAPGAHRVLKNAASGLNVCLTVSASLRQTLPRSPLHGANYRSAVLSGKAHPVSSTTSKRKFLYAFAERLHMDARDTLRHPSAKELKTTAILELNLDDASVRARFARSDIDREQCGWAVWSEEISRALRARRSETDLRDVLKVEPRRQLQR